MDNEIRLINLEQDLENCRGIDEKKDVVIEEFDSHLKEEKYDLVDYLLEYINNHKYETEVLLAFLTVTRPAKQYLRYREEFFENIKELVERRGEKEKMMFHGLE